MSRISVGLDIGTTSVKIVEIQEGINGSPAQVTRWGTVPLPEGAIVDGWIKKRAQVSGAISELMKKTKIAARQMIIAVPEQAVILRLFKIPLQKGEELSDIVKKEATAKIPQPLRNLYLDYQVVGKTDQEEKEIFLACAPKELIHGYRDALAGAGVQPEAVDLQSLSLIRVAHLSQETETGLLNIGAGSATFVAPREDVPIYTRFITNVGKAWSGNIQSQLKLAPAEAEELKQLYADALYETPETVTDPVNDKVNRIVRDDLLKMIGELKKTLEFYRLQQPGGPFINRLKVSGGEARFKNLVPLLEKELQMKVSIMMVPPEQLKPPRETSPEEWQEVFPVLTTALGLALREVMED